MKFRADRDTLLETLVTASRATSARSGPSFGVVGLRLLLRGNQLDVCGSDPDLVIEAPCGLSRRWSQMSALAAGHRSEHAAPSREGNHGSAYLTPRVMSSKRVLLVGGATALASIIRAIAT